VIAKRAVEPLKGAVVVAEDGAGEGDVHGGDALGRFNIGIRTLPGGASMTLRLYDANGTELRTTSRSFPADFFQQFSASELLGTTPSANQAVVITIESGSAIVYGVTDTALQVPRPTSE